MPRLVFLLTALLFSVTLYAEEPDARKLPSVRRVLEKAEGQVRRNREAYEDANDKAYREAEKELKAEADRLSKAGKPEEAVAIKKLTEGLRQEIAGKVDRPARKPNPAQAGAVAWNGHKYKLFAEQRTWHDAKKRCEEIGGHLVIINDEKEQAFLFELLGRNGMPVNLSKRDYAGVWLGATDEEREGEWRWVDGSPLEYTNWSPGDPNNRRVYLALGIHYGGKWDDRSDGDRNNQSFICEWDD